MEKLKIHMLPHWPYDDALAWMDKAHLTVANDRRIILIACGSHAETVITLGRNTQSCNELENISARLPLSVLYRHLDRGGAITAHEPGQLVLYPIFDTGYQRLVVKTIVYILENTMINFLGDLGINAARRSLGPGVFVDDEKIGFVGIRIKNGIVSHGLALNVLNDAKIFSYFNPCGIKGLRVTSAHYHIHLTQPLRYYLERLTFHFINHFFDAQTDIGTSFDVGVLLSNATDSSGTNTLPSGK